MRGSKARLALLHYCLELKLHLLHLFLHPPYPIMNKRIIIAVYCFLICATMLQAQPLQWQWARTARSFDAGLSVQAWNVSADLQGNAYISGDLACDSVFFDSTHVLYPYDPHIGNVFIAKYDSTGNVLWAKNSGGSANAFAYSQCTDAAGNCFVAGIYQYGAVVWGTDTLQPQPAGISIFIVKFDANGTVEWAKSGGGNTGNNLPYDICSDPWGNVYVTGVFQSPVIYFDADSLVNNGQNNMCITKYDAAGNVIWTRGFGGTVSDYANSVSCDAGGNVYITGDFTSPSIDFGTFTLTHALTPNDDVFTLKLDSAGTALWARTGSGGGIEYGRASAVGASGSVYISGLFSYLYPIVFENDTVTDSGSYNVFYAKYSDAGNLQWAKSFAGAFSYEMIADANDNFYMTGRLDTGYVTIGDTTFYSPPFTGTFDMFIAKFDSSGNVLWATSIPDAGDNDNGIALLPDQSLYVCGEFYDTNPLIFGSDSLFLNNSLIAPFLAKTTGQPGLGITTPVPVNGVSVFPNPMRENLYIKFERNESAVFTLYDITARKIASQSFTGTLGVSTSELESGIYLYRILHKNGRVITGKVIKQ